MYDLSGGRRITYKRRKWIYFLLSLLLHVLFCILNWIRLNGQSFAADIDHGCFKAWDKHQHNQFLCPLCSLSDQRSAGSHETITGECVPVCLCMCRADVFVCLFVISGSSYSPTYLGFEGETHRIHTDTNKLNCTHSPHPTVKCLPLGLKCLEDSCLDEFMLAQLLSNHWPPGYIPVKSFEDSGLDITWYTLTIVAL